MAINKLTALEKGNVNNSNGADVAESVNALIDGNELINSTTLELIASTATHDLDTNITTKGYATTNGIGVGSWSQNGVTVQTPSQSPAQLGNSLLNDGNGNQWALSPVNGVAAFESLGGVSGGAVDNALVFQAFLNSGIVGELGNNKSYATGSRSSWVLDKSGFISSGKSKVVMLTAGFNATTYGGYLANSIGFYAEGFDNPIFKDIHIEFEAHGTDIRTASALSIRDCTNMDIDVEASRFSEVQFGIITVDSCIDGNCQVNVHDCFSNDVTLPSIQITGLKVDEDRIGSVYSKGVNFGDPSFKNITLGVNALAQFGYQTDGMTLSGGATSGTGGCRVGIIYVENVYEGLDIQSANHIVAGIQARDIANSPLKLVHAGKNNIVNAVHAENTGGPIVVFVGTSTASESADNNIVSNVSGTGIGSIDSGATKAAVAFLGGAATFKPNNNKILGLTVTDSPDMLNAVQDEAGVGNKVYDVSGEGSVSIGLVDGAQQPLDHVDIRKSPKSFVQGYLSVNTALSDGNNVPYDTVTTDTHSEFNTSTGIFESKSPIRGTINASVRVSSLLAGTFIGLEVVADDVVIASSRSVNDSVSNREGIVNISTSFSLSNVNEQLKVRFRTDSSPITVTGNSELTTFSITEI